jgi:hypothetical protein
MSLGSETVNQSIFRSSLLAALIALSGEAAAIGLGELRGKAALGDKPRFQVDILGAGAGSLDPGCFRLIKPAGDGDLPWLKQATFSVRRGHPPVLEIRSSVPLADPVLAVVVYVSCGHDVVREFVVFPSPPLGRTADASPPGRVPAAAPAERRPAEPARTAVAPRQTVVARPPAVPATVTGQPLEPAKVPVAQAGMAPADDKIKSMEATVGELQQRAAELTQKLELAAATPSAGPPPQPEARPAQPAPAPEPAVATVPASVGSGGSNNTLLGALVGALLAMVGWLFWRNSRGRADGAMAGNVNADVEVDPQRKDEREERGGVDLRVDPVAMGMPMKLEVDAEAPAAPAPAAGTPSRLDSIISVSAATVDEHFEANPVMELAEIMLSFGRVKGAAQALQEYVDSNPQEALKPWIRLMEVYRMAGMRREFEKVARDLNRNFNVEVQRWEQTVEPDSEGPVDVILDTEPVATGNQLAGAKAEGIEGMPAITEQVVMRWNDGSVIDYMNQLLRDNRGGTRLGFSLPVISDILFLVELKEVSNKIESESSTS